MTEFVLTANGLSARRQATSSRSVQVVHEDSELCRQQSRKFNREEYAYQINNLTYAYNTHFKLSINKLNIPAAKIFAVTGPNGSGKTTLLKILSFLLQPQTGEINFFDKDITQTTLLFQETLLLKRTVFDNVAYGLNIRKKNNTAKVNDALMQVGLDPKKFSQRKYNELSGGEAKRVALASRIILQPKVLLLDEPMMNIDKQSWQLIIKILQDLVTQGTTIIVSAHDMDNLNNKLQPDTTHVMGR